jgi:DNA-3-methyladenine glycosylase II
VRRWRTERSEFSYTLRMKQPACDWATAAKHLHTVDAKLRPIIEAYGIPEWKPTRNPLASLGRAIVYQQLSGAAAGTIYKRFVALYDNKFPKPAQLLATDEPTLRGCGLSGAKAAALKDLAAHVADQRVKPSKLTHMSDADVLAALLPVRGIGPWSVDMFLMFALSRPDVLPVGDLGVRKGMQTLYRLRQLPTPETMIKRAKPWQPFRSLGSWYMWRVVDNEA